MILDMFPRAGYKSVPNNGDREDRIVANLKDASLTYAEVEPAIAYDPDLGTFTWKINSSKNVKAGTPAGCFKGVRTSLKTGQQSRYLYIRLHNYEVPAARIAWLLTHGKWPSGNIQFDDGDSANFKLANLREALFKRVLADRGSSGTRKMSQDAQRHYGLKRYYGMDLAVYSEKLLAQNGVCAICEKPETAVMHGKIKPLSVDHNHETGVIRDLLCSSCNHLLGHAREDRNVLIAALKYLDKHSGATPNVVKFSEEKA